MPKNTDCDPITDPEIAFAHLILSGTMTDRRAAEAAGLNPDTAAYTKAKHRVRAYMIEHRAGVKENLAGQEADLSRLPRPAAGRAAEGHKLTIGRDQILDRLWELAALSHEQTRGSIAGQIKALAMIAAIEGLIPDRRLSPHATKPATPPVEPDIYKSEWLRNQQGQPMGEESGDPVADPEPQRAPEPATNLANQAAAPNLDPPQSIIAAPVINPARQNWVPAAADSGLDAFLDTTHSSRQPFSLRRFSGRRR